MKNAYRILPCYAGDVSGVCSALYELGGMVVIHDPSGCNSTYNTHDETRWYDQDSMIYISGLTEMDAILGTDEKLVAEISEAALSLRPEFIALASSPIPYLNGTDLPAIARLIEQSTGIKAFFVPTNGMRDYLSGAGGAFAELARSFVRPSAECRARTVNILGLTPLDFAAEGTAEAMKAVLGQSGWEVLSCWAMGSSLEQIAGAAQAEADLVVSASGLKAARVLEKRFGIPYVCAVPAGGFSADAAAALELAAASGQNRTPYLKPQAKSPSVALIGEPIAMGSLAAMIAQKYGCGTRVFCPLEADASLLGELGVKVQGEDALRTALEGFAHVIADPMYEPIVPASAQLHALPHLAFSGRCYLKAMKNLVTLDI